MVKVDGQEMEVADAAKYLRRKKKEEKIIEEQKEFARIDAEHELYHVLHCLESERPDVRFFFRPQGHMQTTAEEGWLCIHVEKKYGKGIIRYSEVYTEVAWYVEHTNGESFLACCRDRQTGELTWLLLGAYGGAAAGVPIQSTAISDKLTAIARKWADKENKGIAA